MNFPSAGSLLLTTANIFLKLWVSKHGLRGKNLKNLQSIVEYIIGVYYPCWFNVKVKDSWIEGPWHILFQLDCLKSQRKEVLDIVMQTVAVRPSSKHCCAPSISRRGLRG